MTLQWLVRDERQDDVEAIGEVTLAAFKDLAISRQTEPLIILALRSARALAVSLVAETEGKIIGHLAASPVQLSDGTGGWYGLGPVSVLPHYQRRGVGTALMNEGLSRLKAMAARGCCLVGHPEYYRRFGFVNPPDLAHEGVPPEFFMVLSFDGRVPQGNVRFHTAFTAGTGIQAATGQ